MAFRVRKVFGAFEKRAPGWMQIRLCGREEAGEWQKTSRGWTRVHKFKHLTKWRGYGKCGKVCIYSLDCVGTKATSCTPFVHTQSADFGIPITHNPPERYRVPDLEKPCIQHTQKPGRPCLQIVIINKFTRISRHVFCSSRSLNHWRLKQDFRRLSQVCFGPDSAKNFSKLSKIVQRTFESEILRRLPIR